MHKFTVFSILLSVSVVLVLLDVLTHNYLNRQAVLDVNSQTVEDSSTEQADPALSPEGNDGLNQDLEEPSLPSSDSSTQDEEDMESIPSGNTPQGESDSAVELQSVSPSVEPWLTVQALSQAGFQAPVLKNAPPSTLIFQFLEKPSDSSSFQWNLFDGQDYVGTLVEIVAQTETEGFQAYLHLRDEANRFKDLGTVNEMNLYGDASFYFNHFIQSKTIRIVIRRDSRVFALEYRSEAHESMKKLFDILGRAE